MLFLFWIESTAAPTVSTSGVAPETASVAQRVVAYNKHIGEIVDFYEAHPGCCSHVDATRSRWWQMTHVTEAVLRPQLRGISTHFRQRRASLPAPVKPYDCRVSKFLSAILKTNHCRHAFNVRFSNAQNLNS